MVPTKIIPSAPHNFWLYNQYLLVKSEVLLFIPIFLLHITETYWNHAVSKMMIFPIWWLLNSRSLICRKNDFLWVRSPVLAISWFVLVKFKVLILTISSFKSNPDVGRFSSEWSEWCFSELIRSLLWFIGDASFSLRICGALRCLHARIGPAKVTSFSLDSLVWHGVLVSTNMVVDS